MSHPLAEYFRSQANWRGIKADEYPEDARNARCADALESLAALVEDVERGERPELAEAVRALKPHLREGLDLGGEETGHVVSRYGFHHNVTRAHDVDFLEELTTLCLVDAYEHARDGGGGEDWTETLLPCEVAAAQRGVYLPASYFKGPRGQTEVEQYAAADDARCALEQRMSTAWPGERKRLGTELDLRAAIRQALVEAPDLDADAVAREVVDGLNEAELRAALLQCLPNEIRLVVNDDRRAARPKGGVTRSPKWEAVAEAARAGAFDEPRYGWVLVDGKPKQVETRRKKSGK